MEIPAGLQARRGALPDNHFTRDGMSPSPGESRKVTVKQNRDWLPVQVDEDHEAVELSPGTSMCTVIDHLESKLSN